MLGAAREAMIGADLKAFFRASWAPLFTSMLLACDSSGAPSGGEQARSVTAPIIGGYLDTETHGVVALASALLVACAWLGVSAA